MLPLSICARGLSSCRLLSKLWPLPHIRREASTYDSIHRLLTRATNPRLLVLHVCVMAFLSSVFADGYSLSVGGVNNDFHYSNGLESVWHK
jgi:hypothetical protein